MKSQTPKTEPGYLEKDESFDALYADMAKKFPLPIRIDTDGFHASYAMHQTFRRFMPRQQGMKFCEIGCAPGQWLIYFNQFFKYDVAGVDLSGDGVDLTRDNLKSMNIDGRIIHGDAFEMPFGQKNFDVTFSDSFIEHFENPVAVLELHDRMTKPGGYVVVGMPNLRYFNHMIFFLSDRVFRKYSALRDVQKISTARLDLFREGAQKFGWDLLFLDYLGFFVFELYKPPTPEKITNKRRKIGRFVGRKLISNRLFSPAILMIAKKSQQPQP